MRPLESGWKYKLKYTLVNLWLILQSYTSQKSLTLACGEKAWTELISYIYWSNLKKINIEWKFFLTVSLELLSSFCTATWKRQWSPSKGWWLPSPPLPGSSPTTRSSTSKDKKIKYVAREISWFSPCRRWTSGGWTTFLCPSPTQHTNGLETMTCWWEVRWNPGLDQINSTQDQLSMPAAMALNYCCTAACVRDYIKQGLNISCLDYKY